MSLHKSSLRVFLVTAVAVLLISICGILFLIFKTNSIYAYDAETLDYASTLTTMQSSMSVQTSIDALDADLASSAGVQPILSNTWFTDLSGIKADTSQTVKIGTLTAYRGYPFDATPETYFMNVRQAKEDLWNYMDSIGAPAGFTGATLESTLKNFWACDTTDALTSNAKFKSSGTTASGTKYTLIDGVQCYYFAPTPTMLDQTFYSSGAWSNHECATGVDYAKVKFAVVFCPLSEDPTDQSKWIYLPCVVGDVKGHTYPWGVTQTNIKITNNKTLYVANASGGDYAVKVTVSDAGSDDAIKTVVNSSGFTSYYGNIRDGLYCVFETVAMRSFDSMALKNDYTCVGCITYKE